MVERRRHSQSQHGNDSSAAPPLKKLKDHPTKLPPSTARGTGTHNRSNRGPTTARILSDKQTPNSKNPGNPSLRVVESYYPYLDSYAEPEEDPNTKHDKQARTKPPFNAQEAKYLLQFQHQRYDGSDDESGSDNEPGSQDRDLGCENDMEGEEGGKMEEDDEVVVKDITRPPKLKKARTSGSRGKVLLGDFDCQDLAHYARRCVRYAICVIHMFPTSNMFAWEVLEDDLKKQHIEGTVNGVRLYKALWALNGNPLQKKDLITYMNYGQCSVRYAFAQDARIRVVEFYGFSTMDGSSKSSLINWLTTGYKFHYDPVNVNERTIGEYPFLCPLIGHILRGYLMDGRPSQDQMLIQELHRTKIIPIQLIALVAVTIYHCLSEHSSGSSNRNDVSGTNLVDCYDDMIGHLQLISDNTPEYLELLQERLYQKMMTKPRVVAPANFNYGALTAYARVEREVDKKQTEERREVKQKRGEEKKRAERQRKEEEEREKERKKAERKRRKEEVRRREERKKAERKEESRSKREEQKGRNNVVRDVDYSMDEDSDENFGDENSVVVLNKLNLKQGQLFDSDLEEDDEPQSQAYLEELDKQQDQLVGSDDSPLLGLVAEEIDEVVVNEEGPAKVQLPSIEVIDVETGEEEMPNDRGSRGKGTSRDEEQSKPGVTTRRSVRTKNKALSGMRMIAGPGVISGPK